MASTNNNIYPVNARRLTSADLIPIFGSFIDADRNNQDRLVYMVNVGKQVRRYSWNNNTSLGKIETESLDNGINRYDGLDLHFVSANKNDTSLFKYNNGGFYDARGGSGTADDPESTDDQLKKDEIMGYTYNGWNYLTHTNNQNERAGKLYVWHGRSGIDTSVVLFPELNVKIDTDLPENRGKTLYGINDWRTDFEGAKNTIIEDISTWETVTESNIEQLADDINNNLLTNKLLNTGAADYYNNDNFYSDLQRTLTNIFTETDQNGNRQNDETIKNRYKNYVNHLCTSLQDDLFTPINASMLKPTYEFDADVLPDTNFRCNDGIYSYRKFYSYQYNQWYYKHVSLWWRPWIWWNNSSRYWWWNYRWHNSYAWFWHSWWWNYWYWPKYIIKDSITERTGETVMMCNVFKYNTYYPTEYIPIEPVTYYDSKGITNVYANYDKFRGYVDYLTSTYKSNIYKINSYIKNVNKMVDNIIAVCDYIVYDNDNTPVQDADINYNIVYDKFQRIDISTGDNSALKDSTMNTFYTKLLEDMSESDINAGLSEDDQYKQPISEWCLVNGIDITTEARLYFPIKPIYLLITPKTQNNTNKIIKYKVNLYQYGNIDQNKILSFVMYQMPRLITIKYVFNCGGYNIRKDTFGILGNVNNSSPSAAANVNIVTNTEFDEAEVRDYHTSVKRYNMGDNTVAINNMKTRYKYGVRRFYNGASTIESKVNQKYDDTKSTEYIPVDQWGTYDEGELPILALNDQDHIVVFLSTIAMDTGHDDYNNFFNSSSYVTFNLHTEDYNCNVNVTMNGHKNMFKNNNIYNASNDNWDLHWGSNITGINFRAYPDVKDTTYRNSNANIMFSHLFGYRIYLKHWFTSSQVSTQEVAVNGKRLKISFVWVNLPVVSSFWNTGNPNS